MPKFGKCMALFSTPARSLQIIFKLKSAIFFIFRNRRMSLHFYCDTVTLIVTLLVTATIALKQKSYSSFEVCN